MKDECDMEKLQKQNVLFFTRTMGLGGTENVVLQLCEIFKPLVNSIVVCSCGGVNVGKLNEMGIKHYLIPDIDNKSISTIINTCKKIKVIVKKENITIIHTHHRMAAFYVSVLGLYRKCVFIATAHNTFHDKKFLTHFAYKKCNVIACGEMVKKNLVEYYELSENQVTVIHNAVKPFVGEIIEDPQVKKLHEEGCFVIGNIGRLSEQKGMEYYIKAIPEVIKECPQARFVIAGSGEDESKLKELSEYIGADKYLTFLGYRNDVQNLMSQLDLVVLSSLWEGFPLTPIEAFSVGKTVIGTAVDGTTEIIKDGINGLLVEPKKPDELADKICLLVENKGFRKKLENNALSDYNESFSFEKLSEQYITFYKSIIKQGGSHGKI